MKTVPFPTGIPAGALAFLSAAYQTRYGKTGGKGGNGGTVVIVASNQEAESLAAEATTFLEQEQIDYFPGFEGIPYEYTRTVRDLAARRSRVLYRLLGGERLLIFASVDAVLRLLVPPENFRSRIRRLRVGEELNPRELTTLLASGGFERRDRVETPGEFCAKGSIIDFFPAQTDVPLRIEFFDDLIESIRLFDPETQSGLTGLEECSVLPVGEVILSAEESAILQEKMKGKEFSARLKRPRWSESKRKGGAEDFTVEEGSGALSQLLHPGLQELFPLATPTVSLSAYFERTPLKLVFTETAVSERRFAIRREFETLYEQEKSNRICLSPDRLLDDSFFEEQTPDGMMVVLNTLPDQKEQAVRDLKEKTEPSPEARRSRKKAKTSDVRGEAAPLFAPPERFRGRIREIRERILAILDEGGSVTIFSPYSAQLNRIAAIFRGEQKIDVRIFDSEEERRPPVFRKQNALRLCRSLVRQGWVLPAQQAHFFSDADIFGRSYTRRSRFKQLETAPLDSFIDLKENDYVVHVNHGVGRFLGLERVTAAGRERDFLVLEYAGEDRLYVPLDQISMVQRYIAAGEKPRLDSLGKSSFKKIKERVEKRVEELARSLLQLYAFRSSQTGFQFPPDTAWQEEFEAEFEYEETPDQITAIEAVKQDMETPRPMDRLICGDVGYGKTEVAIRAAFKSVMAGKQVVLIAPTTILALQHFRTFQDRYRNYPVQIDWISRFRSRRDIGAVKKKMAGGDVDVVIGTHALLGEDIRFKNLGLLIVDEEQRFGVTHKESIKKIKKLVDVLTMSATPIPRTLHMSLVGIRDLSIIQTSPRDRMPVRTYVMEDSDTVMREAIQRELERGGQIFFLHNRIETIEAAAQKLHSLVPRAGYTVLHGRMPEDEIEDVLMDFLERRYDILVTTSIIESGIDMPNVNTLIVDRADTFGLAQLYQIRGRVGRSNRQAYAYFFYPAHRSLNEIAQKRLNTIQEYQDLGSGFKVAMRDLEIRGAGNILGKEQSGDIMDVGFELYVRLLNDAIRRLQGEPVESEIRCYPSLNFDFFLAAEYIPDTRQRIEIYKRFEAALEVAEVDQLGREMTDRFGRPPQEALNFLIVHRIRCLATRIGFESVFQEESGRFRMKAGTNFRIPIAHVFRMVEMIPGLSLTPGNTESLFYTPPAGAAGSGGESLIEILTEINQAGESVVQ